MCELLTSPLLEQLHVSGLAQILVAQLEREVRKDGQRGSLLLVQAEAHAQGLVASGEKAQGFAEETWVEAFGEPECHLLQVTRGFQALATVVNEHGLLHRR